MPFPVRPFSWAVRTAINDFGKSDRRLEEQLYLSVTDLLREICVDFPYWFLTVEPGIVVPAALPYAVAPTTFLSPGNTRFLDQGWFLTSTGVEYYPLFVALDQLGNQNWAPVEASQIHWVNQYTIEGGFCSNIAVNDSEVHFSQGAPRTSNPGVPQSVMPYTQNGVTYLRFNPVPQDEYLIATSFQLAYPPWIQVGNEITNWAFQYFPRLIELCVKICYANFYHEVEAKKDYMRELYGDAGGKVRSDIPFGGLIATMKNDTWKRNEQRTQETPLMRSSLDAVGRGGYGQRRPGSSYYTDP